MALQVKALSMDASASNPSVQMQRHRCGANIPGEFPLSAYPTMVLHILSYNLDYHDLASLEATCSFFRRPVGLVPHPNLSLAELAAFEMCRKRAVFKPMSSEESEVLRERYGGSWKLVLRFLMTGESCYRREKSQAIAGPGHSVVVTASGSVYSFGHNCSGQLGHGTFVDEPKPVLIRSLQGIRIIQAAAGSTKTMLVSDAGRVYLFGKNCFGEFGHGNENELEISGQLIATPTPVESLKGIFIVQVTIGNCFTAVLSREGRVYTFSWGSEEKLGHECEMSDREPRLLGGPLENMPVVQISAGFCYLLALAIQPTGMSVYSVGCGLGGKLGHGSKTNEKYPRLIEQIQALNLQPVAIAAGLWHAVVLGKDGRVCTWGWGNYGCLGHGDEECQIVPKVVEALSTIKAVHVAAGDCTTFVVSDEGDAYSFGCDESSNLGQSIGNDEQSNSVLQPAAAMSLKKVVGNSRIKQISCTNSIYGNAHTFALTDSGKLYSFGAGEKGQLGVQLEEEQVETASPELVCIDLR